MTILCDICKSTDVRVDEAEYSPFISQRIWGKRPDVDVHLVSCNYCGYSYFIPRPTDYELNKLYADYRGNTYQIQRQKYEPLYTNQVNAELSRSSQFRKKTIGHILTNNKIKSDKISTVLDYGGGCGDMFPDMFSKCEKYVYDISNIALLPWVKRITDPDQFNQQKFDYVQCCHTLEHCSDPNDLIKNILKSTHKNTIIYVEVPNDVEIKSAKVMFFLNHPVINKIFAIITGKSTNRYRIMHEHINFFTKRSLCLLLYKNNITIKNINVTGDSIYCIGIANHRSETIIY